MNILFFTREEVSPHKGGTERITHTLSNGLKKYYGHKCFSAFLKADISSTFLTDFEGKLEVNRYSVGHSIRKYAEKNNINRIIIQGEFGFVMDIKKSIKGIDGCKLIFVHHFEPGFEKKFFRLKDILECIRKRQGIAKFPHIVQLFLFPFLRFRFLQRLPKLYCTAYQFSDQVVLLSQKYQEEFMKLGCISDAKKISYIPNALSYSQFMNKEDIVSKERIVLIVSRLDERQKRISLAIKIWKIVKKYSESKDWKLHIVGDGEYRKIYQNIVKDQKIKDVYFLGQMEPSNEYKKASLFMMTSVSEGWGLTLTEAQQFGCIPIAFDTYLSLHDIIENGINGFIIPEMDIQAYVHTILDLITNAEKRILLAYKCVDTSREFAVDKIVNRWDALLTKLK